MHVFPYFPRMRKGMITCLNYKDVHRNVFCRVYRTTSNIIFRIVLFSIHLWAKDGAIGVLYCCICHLFDNLFREGSIIESIQGALGHFNDIWP